LDFVDPLRSLEPQTSAVTGEENRHDPDVTAALPLSPPSSAEFFDMMSDDEDDPADDATTAELQEAYDKAYRLQKEAQRKQVGDSELLRHQTLLSCLQSKTLRLLHRLTTAKSHGELRTDLNVVTNKVDEHERRLGGHDDEIRSLHLAVEYLYANVSHVKKNMERVEDEQRRRNVVVYGAAGTDVQAILRRLLHRHQSLYNDIDVAYFMGKAKDGAKRPIIIHFSLQSSAASFLRLARNEEYMQQHPGITAARDKSVTRRVGVSRLSASASCLTSTFPGLEVHEFSEFATYKNVRYDATEFAEKVIDIHGRSFNVEEACRRNPRYELNEALFLQIGDMKVDGFRRKDRQTGNNGSNPSGSRWAAGQQQQEQGTARRTGLGVPNINATSTGGIVISTGASTRHSGNAPTTLIGANSDPYEVRGYPIR
jgi:hypothetical protein